MRTSVCSFALLFFTAWMPCGASAGEGANSIPGRDVYRQWEPVNSEPIPIASQMWMLCMPPPDGWNTRHQEPPQAGVINVYVSPKARKSYLHEQNPSFPIGTVIVKEKLRSPEDSVPSGTGVMIKSPPSRDSGQSRWRFIYIDEGGRVFREPPEVENCESCHQTRSSTDYVFRSFQVTKEPPK